MARSALAADPSAALLQVGDRVYYIGLVQQLQADYGSQVLTLVALDRIRGIAVCENRKGCRLVGVSVSDLRPNVRSALRL
ncbi:hypothetical protein [Pseudanabaena sp. FACHB-2040]|uniref:hypothetical protein n=1 Tax=Pseudanabaena sp. FACHB-2040 TaxID=2692859 RepID=UPI001688F82E|nr:hypothetical protein [Pseudanabaena sp. FACHB-2040]MBD2256566.1 hypothetical protein [Pseudanabaena sp. FACHB-2040]